MRKFTGNDLRLLRQSRHVKQKTIAAKMNISIQRYSELENNEDRPEKRTIEILTTLGYTIESALKLLESIP